MARHRDVPVTKAHHGALLLAGGTPFFLPADRNAYGNGRIATTLFVVYPPGIATIVATERLSAADNRISQNFRTERKCFPWVRSRGSGLYREVDEKGAIRFYTYVVRE